MGIRSKFALANVTDAQVVEIATRFQSLLDSFANPINFSIVKMDAAACTPCPVALGIIAFLSREVFGFDAVPMSLQTHLTLQSDSTPEIEHAWNDLLKLPCIAIAQIASEIAGKAYSVIHNDTLCSTGVLEFQNGELISGSVVGSGGSNYLFQFDGNVASVQTVDYESGFNYVDTIKSEFVRLFGDSDILVTLMNDQLEELGRCQIMEARVLITPPKIAT
jgi:hypothetical protein